MEHERDVAKERLRQVKAEAQDLSDTETPLWRRPLYTGRCGCGAVSAHLPGLGGTVAVQRSPAQRMVAQARPALWAAAEPPKRALHGHAPRAAATAVYDETMQDEATGSAGAHADLMGRSAP